jgi:hypothetical protein
MRWMPVLVAVVSVLMLITFPLAISNFHKMHTNGEVLPLTAQIDPGM